MAEALTDLAAHGPSEEELTLAVARLEESLATTDRELASAFGVINGCAIPVAPQMFHGSGAALDELARRTDPGLWFDESAFTRDQDDH
ncbi:hypothetical protein [Kribbella sp. CA-293567]|uniref:hypothetical protein n=1 Tax=Kribbella sp. CA-293567 TaxID=3002436 RepID=UPI0022DE3011|nr:hypothetical protein [Kribbella sp. CA-293567]WBQ03406.1 hypothetical protein OX958_25950 [Kribbella sp. CA-293567]